MKIWGFTITDDSQGDGYAYHMFPTKREAIAEARGYAEDESDDIEVWWYEMNPFLTPKELLCAVMSECGPGGYVGAGVAVVIKAGLVHVQCEECEYWTYVPRGGTAECGDCNVELKGSAS